MLDLHRPRSACSRRARRHFLLAVGAIVAVLVAGSVSRAAADDGATYLSWEACPGSHHAAPGVPFDCLPEGGSVYTLIGTFTVDHTIAGALSMDADVSIAFPELSELPPFWSIVDGGCNRPFAIVRTMPDDCPDHVNAFCSGDTNRCDLNYSASVLPGTSILRLSITASAAYPSTATLAQGQRYFAFTLNIPMTGAANCTGCTAPSAIGFSQGRIYALDGHGGLAPPVTVTGSHPGANACATANDGFSECTTVPTRRLSWGRLKSLYR